MNIIILSWHEIGNILGIVLIFWMPEVVVVLVCKEKAKQFYKIPGIKFKLFCLYLFTKSVSIFWLALIVTRVYQHFSNANISVKQICLGGGRGNVHFIPKKKTTYESNCSIRFSKSSIFNYYSTCLAGFCVEFDSFQDIFQRPLKLVNNSCEFHVCLLGESDVSWISLYRTSISFLFTSLVLQSLIITYYEIIGSCKLT